MCSEGEVGPNTLLQRRRGIRTNYRDRVGFQAEEGLGRIAQVVGKVMQQKLDARWGYWWT